MDARDLPGILWCTGKGKLQQIACRVMVGIILAGHGKVTELPIFPPVADTVTILVKAWVCGEENQPDEFGVVDEGVTIALPAAENAVIAPLFRLVDRI